MNGLIDKLKAVLGKLKEVSQLVQQVGDIKGSLYVDLFGIVMMIRLLAVIKGFPPLSASEAAVWGSTIGSLAYSNGGPRNS